MSVAELTSPGTTAPASRMRRLGPWLLAGIPWLAAIVLGASLAWAVPRADDARALGERLAALNERAETLDAATDRLAGRVTALRDDLADAERRGADLRRQMSLNDGRILRLHHQIAARREALAAAAAAAAAAEAAASAEASYSSSTSTGSGNSSSVQPPAALPPYDPPEPCFVGPGGGGCG